MRVALPPRTRDLPVSTVELVERAASELLQNRDGDGRRSQLSFQCYRRGMVVPCREGNGTQEHTTETVSQWSSRSNGVMCSCLLAEKTNRAAAFRTECSRSSRFPGTPVRTELQ